MIHTILAAIYCIWKRFSHEVREYLVELFRLFRPLHDNWFSQTHATTSITSYARPTMCWKPSPGPTSEGLLFSVRHICSSFSGVIHAQNRRHSLPKSRRNGHTLLRKNLVILF